MSYVAQSFTKLYGYWQDQPGKWHSARGLQQRLRGNSSFLSTPLNARKEKLLRLPSFLSSGHNFAVKTLERFFSFYTS